MFARCGNCRKMLLVGQPMTGKHSRGLFRYYGMLRDIFRSPYFCSDCKRGGYI